MTAMFDLGIDWWELGQGAVLGLIWILGLVLAAQMASWVVPALKAHLPWISERPLFGIVLHLAMLIAATLIMSVALSHLSKTLVAGILLALAVLRLLVVRYVANKAAKQNAKFNEQFAATIDTMVRGLRAGLPLFECFQLIVDEAEPVIAREFESLMAEHALGVPLHEALDRLALRLKTPDVQFFALIVGLHSSVGGALADTLEALADTLRRRQGFQERITILSQEARSSAYIIGALPFLVGLGMWIVNPGYAVLLVETTTGRWALLLSGLWMVAGVQIMKRMININV